MGIEHRRVLSDVLKVVWAKVEVITFNKWLISNVHDLII